VFYDTAKLGAGNGEGIRKGEMEKLGREREWKGKKRNEEREKGEGNGN